MFFFFLPSLARMDCEPVFSRNWTLKGVGKDFVLNFKVFVKIFSASWLLSTRSSYICLKMPNNLQQNLNSPPLGPPSSILVSYTCGSGGNWPGRPPIGEHSVPAFYSSKINWNWHGLHIDIWNWNRVIVARVVKHKNHTSFTNQTVNQNVANSNLWSQHWW